MKMFDKAQCEYKGGYIVCDDEIVAVDNEIVDLFNKLESDIQRSRFEASNCGELPCYKEPGEFVRVSEYGRIMPHVEAKTPELDALAEHTLKLMDEIDAMGDADRTNEYFGGIKPLIQFVNDKFIVSGDQATQHRFDLPTVGNPLELDVESLSKLVMEMF